MLAAAASRAKALEGHHGDGRLQKYEELLTEKDHEVTVMRKVIWGEGQQGKTRKRRHKAKKTLLALNGAKEVHASPNTVGTIKQMAKVRDEDTAPGGYESIMTWAFVFARPKARNMAKDADGQDLPVPSHEVAVSHECWMFCERAIASDLLIEIVVPNGGKTIIISVGASYDILVDEAQAISMPMRMQETKGTMEFHKDLIRYYASSHGGLNEYQDGRWEGRDPNLCAGENHWKSPLEHTEEGENKMAIAAQKIFPSSVAQRLVMSRLRRRAHYDPDWMMSIGDDKKALKYIAKHIGHESAIAVSHVYEALVCIGGFRPGAASIFPTLGGRTILTDFARMAVHDPNHVMKATAEHASVMAARYVERGHDADREVTYAMIPDFLRIAEEWQEGMGREEMWIHTLKSYFPLHAMNELAYLKEQWGSPALLFQCRITGYNPECMPNILNPANPDQQRPAEIELNTFGSAGNVRAEHTFPGNLTYQPLEEIRDYFGDGIGLYFSWLGVYTKALAAMSVLGTVVMVAQPLYGGLRENPLTLAYSIYTGLWSISFIEAWHRRENELRFLCKKTHDIFEMVTQYISSLISLF